MSEENVVRQRLAVRPTSRRRLGERLALRFPRAGALFVRAILRLRPRSWLRRTLVRFSLRLVIEAINRGDPEAAFALYPPDCETITNSELMSIGFERVYRGREERLRFQRDWLAELGEFQQEAKEVIDCGDRILLLVRMKGSGLASQAAFDTDVAYLLTISGGRPIREQLFRSHDQALKAAGLSDSDS
jgi:hypothetical protein